MQDWSTAQQLQAKEKFTQFKVQLAAEAQQHQRELEAGKRETTEGIRTMRRDESAAARVGIEQAKEEATYASNMRYADILMSHAEQNERAEKHKNREQKDRLKVAADTIVTASKEEIMGNMEIEQRKEQLAEAAEMEAKAAEKKLKESEKRNAELKKQADEASSKQAAAEIKSKETAQKAKAEAMAAIAQAREKSKEDTAKQKAKEAQTKSMQREKTERDGKAKVKAMGLSFGEEQAMLNQLEAQMAAANAAHEASVKQEEAQAEATASAEENAQKTELRATMEAAKRALLALKASRQLLTAPRARVTVAGDACVDPYYYDNSRRTGCIVDAKFEGPQAAGWCPAGTLGAQCFSQAPTDSSSGACSGWPADSEGAPTGKWAPCALGASKHQFTVSDDQRPAGACGKSGALLEAQATSSEQAQAVCSGLTDCVSFAWDSASEIAYACGVDTAGSGGVVPSSEDATGWSCGDKEEAFTEVGITEAVTAAQKEADDAESALMLAQGQAGVARKRRSLSFMLCLSLAVSVSVSHLVSHSLFFSSCSISLSLDICLML